MLNILAMLAGRYLVAAVALAVIVPAAVLSALVRYAGAIGGAA